MTTLTPNFYIGLARYVATASRDPSTKVGAVIVRPDRTIASVGFNGMPRGMSDAPELYLDRATKLSRTIHAEVNAILNAAEPVKGYDLYVSALPPCAACALVVVQSGIRRVFYERPSEELAQRWADSLAQTRTVFGEVGIEMVEVEND